MRAGPLRHRVIFERPVVVRDSYGQETTVWTEAVTLWAQIAPVSGRELLASNNEVAEGTIRIRVRANPGLDSITPKWRCRFRERIFNIRHINDLLMLKSEYEILVTEDVTGG